MVYQTNSPQDQILKNDTVQASIRESTAKRAHADLLMNIVNGTCLVASSACIAAGISMGSPIMFGYASSSSSAWIVFFFMALMGMCEPFGFGGGLGGK